MNNKGQIIITDLLLYVIVLTIILGLIIFTMETLNDNQVTMINSNQLNDILENNLNMLVKTSGTPDNWEYLNNKDIKTIGLKSKKNNLISYDKLLKLKNNNQLLNNYFPTGVSYELTLCSKNTSNNNMLISGTSFSNKKQVLSKSETILIDYGYQIIQFDSADNNETCYYNHDTNWKCKAFTVNNTLLNEGEYYIITTSDTEYILSNTFNENITDTAKGIKKITNKIKQLTRNENETINMHTKNNNQNTYLVYDKNNRQEFLKQLTKPEIYELNLKIAI